MKQTGEAQVTRRVLLATATAGLALAGCAPHSARPTAPNPPDPQTVLLLSLIDGKEQVVTLYHQAILGEARLAVTLEPFRQRHLAHLAALRKLLPPNAEARHPPSPSGTPSPGAGGAVSVARLRATERRAAAQRPAQLAGASPVLAQLLASIGACEAVHAAALGRLRD